MNKKNHEKSIQKNNPIIINQFQKNNEQLNKFQLSDQNQSLSAVQSLQQICEENLVTFKYLIMSHRQLGFIYRRIKQPQAYQLNQVRILNSLTIKDMIQKIKTDQNMTEDQQLRIWKIGPTTVQKVWCLIRKQCRKFFKDDYIIRLPGKIINPQKVINKLKIKQNQFLIVEKKQIDRESWHFYQPKKGICAYCNIPKDLKEVCPCNMIKYCSLECKKKNLKLHAKECSYYIELIKTNKQQQDKFVQEQKKRKQQNQQNSEKQEEAQIQVQRDSVNLNKDYNKYMCKICFIEKSTRINEECRHLMMCRNCYANLRQISESYLLKCPCCRKVGRYRKYITPIYV